LNPFFIFFLGAQCVESGVSCTDWIFEKGTIFFGHLYYNQPYDLDGPSFDSRQRKENFFFSKTPRPALEPTQPRIPHVSEFFLMSLYSKELW